MDFGAGAAGLPALAPVLEDAPTGDPGAGGLALALASPLPAGGAGEAERRGSVLQEAAIKAQLHVREEKLSASASEIAGLKRSNERLKQSSEELAKFLAERDAELEAKTTQLEAVSELVGEVQRLRVVIDANRAGRSAAASTEADPPAGWGAPPPRPGPGVPALPPPISGPVAAAVKTTLLALEGPAPGAPSALALVPAAGRRRPASPPKASPNVQAVALRFLQSMALLRDVSRPMLQFLAKRAATGTLDPGAYVLQEGEVPQRVLMVVAGALAVFVQEGDERVALNEVAANDVLSEMCLVTAEPSTATVQAKTPVQFLSLGRADLDAALAAYPECQQAVRQAAAKRIRTTLMGSERVRRASVVSKGPLQAPDPAALQMPFIIEEEEEDGGAGGRVPDGPLEDLTNEFAVPVVQKSEMMRASEVEARYDIRKLLRTVPLLRQVPDRMITFLVGLVKVRNCLSGEVVVNEDDVAREAYLVLSGTLRISKRGGSQVVLGVAKAGDIIGEASILQGAKRTATVTAVTDSHLLCIHNDDLEKVFAELPGLRSAMMVVMDEREKQNRLAMPSATRMRRKMSMMTPVVEELGPSGGSFDGGSRDAPDAAPREDVYANCAETVRDASGVIESSGGLIRDLEGVVRRLKADQGRRRRSTEAQSRRETELTEALEAERGDRAGLAEQLAAQRRETERAQQQADAIARDHKQALADLAAARAEAQGLREAEERRLREIEEDPEATLLELQKAYAVAAAKERAVLVKQRSTLAVPRTGAGPFHHHGAPAAPAAPAEAEAPNAAAEGLLGALGSVKKEVQSFSESVLVLEGDRKMASVLPGAADVSILVTPGKRKKPFYPADREADRVAQLAVIDSLLDSFQLEDGDVGPTPTQ